MGTRLVADPNPNYYTHLITRSLSEASLNGQYPMYSVWIINLTFPAWRHSWITVSCVTFFNFHEYLLIYEIFYGNHFVDTLSRYRSAYVIGFIVILIIITIIGKKCQNTHFFTRFPHCVEVFEEMVGDWRMRVIWLKSAFLASPDRLHFIWKHYTHKKKYSYVHTIHSSSLLLQFKTSVEDYRTRRYKLIVTAVTLILPK